MAGYTGVSGQFYQLDKQIAAGGEGIVYEIRSISDKVAKIYKADHFKSESERQAMERKLRAMLSFNIQPFIDGKLRLAWPQDILFENGKMVGFVMPSVKSRIKIFDICRSSPGGIRYKIYPQYTWLHSVQYAYLLAWVVDYVHKNNVIIGDMNPNNIIIDTDNSTVILIDCDSFDITDPKTGEHFPCTVGLPEVLAPEIQGVVDIKKATFSKDSDNFSLAIHLFRLLMNNESPFGGVQKDLNADSKSVGQITADPDILGGECPYVRECSYKVRPTSPPLSMLPRMIQDLFIRTFDYKQRTALKNITFRATAGEWRNALYKIVIGGQAQLKTCNHNTYGGPHLYPPHNTQCPWCAVEKAANSSAVMPPPPKPVYTPKPAPVTKPVPVQKTVSSSYSAGSQTQNTQTTYTPSGYRTRSAFWLYFILFLFGVAPAFLIGQDMKTWVEAMGQLEFPTLVYSIALGVVGGITGLVIAHWKEDKYRYSRHPFVYFFLVILVQILTVLITLALGAIGSLLAAFISAILSVIGVIIVLIICCVCCRN